MEVKILGVGCARCNGLEKLVRDVVAEQGIDATIIKVTQYEEILKYPILGLPGLVVDEKVKVFGRVPAKRELIKWLAEAQATAVEK